MRTWQVGESNLIYLRCASKNRFWNGINQKISKEKHKTWEKFYKIFGNLYIVFLSNHVRETIKFCVWFCHFASYLTTLSPWFKHHQYKRSVYKYFKWNESAFNFHFNLVPHCRDFSCTVTSENVCFWWIMSTHAAYVEVYKDLLQCSNLIWALELCQAKFKRSLWIKIRLGQGLCSFSGCLKCQLQNHFSESQWKVMTVSLTVSFKAVSEVEQNHS